MSDVVKWVQEPISGVWTLVIDDTTDIQVCQLGPNVFRWYGAIGKSTASGTEFADNIEAVCERISGLIAYRVCLRNKWIAGPSHATYYSRGVPWAEAHRDGDAWRVKSLCGRVELVCDRLEEALT